MKTTQELLALLKTTEADTFEDIQKRYLTLKEQQEKLEKLKRMGAVNPFGPQPATLIPVADLKNAWANIDSESKYQYFKSTGTFLAISSSQTNDQKESTDQKLAPQRVTPILDSLTKERPLFKNRRLPSRARAKTSLKADDEVAPIAEPQSTPVFTSESKDQRTSIPTVPEQTNGSTPVESEKTVTKNLPSLKELQEMIRDKVPRVIPAHLQSKLTTNTIQPQTNNATTPVEANSQLTAKELQEAVFKAVQDYTAYHTGGNKGSAQLNRGQGDGLFSFLRHGAKGLATANALYNSINSDNMSVQETVKVLKDFMSNSSRAYHHHSFTSYLADALAQKGVVTAHKTSRYNQNEVIQEMEQWILANSTSQANKTL
ncbi:hypothetical protein [Legionella bononiensis]|uniref:Substrate of the Dot/Icm secretion system n=1 Tax=Legionella bononiensis TaxID=2793102 RepID=A0ABS1WFG1_9GAMM|nr:hypothetical protein [Legionella bononiensis]MBL7481533.1 hypothetical protein [Legionella bononiensis]MBL7528080.1 hypothetical protein [Legionella bononiensis]MBL7562556.1 hypothetical protein [Legionella bononiensis]